MNAKQVEYIEAIFASTNFPLSPDIIEETKNSSVGDFCKTLHYFLAQGNESTHIAFLLHEILMSLE